MRLRLPFLLCLLVSGLILPGAAFAQQKPGPIAPAEKRPEGWEEIDQRLIFLMVRLANVEASLDAVEKAIGKNTGKRASNLSAAKRAEAGNDLMDRKGGGPMKWSEFYGTTAEKFFYHPTDRNSTYHTFTVLAQKSPEDDNRGAEGVPSRQGLPVHQRPPQFDYIYRANVNAKERAEAEASELKGKIESLLKRRRRLEAEQNGLWCEVAFRAISHYDLDKKPLYRFEPMVADATSDVKQHAETLKAAALFMRLALSIIEEAQKDQATTFSKIKPAISDARLKLSDAFLRLTIDVTDRNSAPGKFASLAKCLDDVASNLSDSYVIANEGDQAKDQQRKDTFRAMLQESLVNYAQIILALDEMSALMRDQWKIKPDVDKLISAPNLAVFASVQPIVSPPLATNPDLKNNTLPAKSLDVDAERLDTLEGTWNAIGVEANGRPETTVTKCRFSFVKRKMTMTRLHDGVFRKYEGVYEIDTTKGSFDFTGNSTHNESVVFRGIYKLDGDSLTICFKYSNDIATHNSIERPSQFTTNKTTDMNSFLVVLRRDRTSE